MYDVGLHWAQTCRKRARSRLDIFRRASAPATCLPSADAIAPPTWMSSAAVYLQVSVEFVLTQLPDEQPVEIVSRLLRTRSLTCATERMLSTKRWASDASGSAAPAGAV